MYFDDVFAIATPTPLPAVSPNLPHPAQGVTHLRLVRAALRLLGLGGVRAGCTTVRAIAFTIVIGITWV